MDIKVLGTSKCLATEGRGKTEARAHNVIHTGIVEAVEQIESLSYKLNVGLFCHLETAGDAHVE